MQQYLDLIRHVMGTGVRTSNRTGIDTKGVFGYQMRFDLAEGFPLVTTKKVYFKAVVAELIWFLRGDTNVRWLQERGVKIWDAWADENGELGPVYGKQWRSWPKGNGKWSDSPTTIDQIAKVIRSLKENPSGRRHIVSAWNPADVDSMALPPCHCLFQFYVAEGKLSCQLYQRSADVFLGVPFNIASYALLTHMIAQVVGIEVGEFIHTFGDVHIYENHLEQCWEQLHRDPLKLPSIRLNEAITDIDDFTTDDITLVDYISHPALKGAVAV